MVIFASVVASFGLSIIASICIGDLIEIENEDGALAVSFNNLDAAQEFAIVNGSQVIDE